MYCYRFPLTPSSKLGGSDDSLISVKGKQKWDPDIGETTSDLILPPQIQIRIQIVHAAYT
jgi:hypothetical protein